MRTHIILSTCLLLTAQARAETFLGWPASSTPLTVASNEAIVISTISVPRYSTRAHCWGSINGQSFSCEIYCPSVGEWALAGPATINFEAGNYTTAPVVCFKRLSGSGIQSVYTPKEAVTNSISVPEGKVCRFFVPFGYSPSFTEAAISVPIMADFGTNSVGPVFLRGREELTGLRSFSILSDTEGIGSVVSFYFTDEALQLPDGLAVQAPTGDYTVTVEKSLNLTNWFPSVIQSATSAEKAFYRLKISR